MTVKAPMRGNSSVYACLLQRDQVSPLYLSVSAPEGVIAPGRRVEVWVPARASWMSATVVEGWEHGLGSVLCLELGEEVR